MNTVNTANTANTAHIANTANTAINANTANVKCKYYKLIIQNIQTLHSAKTFFNTKKLNFGIPLDGCSLDFAQFHVCAVDFWETSCYFRGHSNITLRTYTQQSVINYAPVTFSA